MDAWYENPKLLWILGIEGHGGEWERVFRISLADQECRSSLAIISWHYPTEGTAPRLVTAYPTP